MKGWFTTMGFNASNEIMENISMLLNKMTKLQEENNWLMQEHNRLIQQNNELLEMLIQSGSTEGKRVAKQPESKAANAFGELCKII